MKTAKNAYKVSFENGINITKYWTVIITVLKNLTKTYFHQKKYYSDKYWNDVSAYIVYYFY